MFALQVLLNDYWDVPMMGDRAFAISPGLYSLVSIERTNVRPDYFYKVINNYNVRLVIYVKGDKKSLFKTKKMNLTHY